MVCIMTYRKEETEAATILQFFPGLRGTLWVTFEEGTWSV